MQAASVVVHSDALAGAVSRKTLGEGSSVFVRVLKNNGNGSFIVGFAGSKFNIKSELPLKEGSSFFAKIKLDGQKVILIPQKTTTTSANQKENIVLNSSALANSLLQNAGLVADNVSLALLQQLKMLNMKFDMDVLKRAYQISKKFNSKQKTAAQSAIILKSKGLGTSQKIVQAILQDESNREKSPDKGQRSFQNQLSSDEQHEKCGLLALFNHLGFVKGTAFSNNWIRIPFEYSSEQGFLNLFLDVESKSVLKGVLKFTFKNVVCDTVMYFDKNRLCKIKSALPFSLSEYFEGVEFENAKDEIDDFDCDDFDFFSVDGVV